MDITYAILLAVISPIVTFAITKLVKKSYRIGIFEFSVSIKGYKALEEENCALKAENEALKIKAGIVTEAWQHMAKKELCEDCESKK